MRYSLLLCLLASNTGIGQIYESNHIGVVIRGQLSEQFPSCTGHKIGEFRNVVGPYSINAESFELCVKFAEDTEARYWIRFPRKCELSLSS